MWVRQDVESLVLAGPTGLTIGAFDGVHLGHQALIRRMAAEAHGMGHQAVVLTFDPLPRQVLGPQKHGVLSTLEERLECIASLGVDGIIVHPFDRQVALIPATDFVTWLVEKLALTDLWVGPDFALGHNHEGNIPFLKAFGARRGFAVHVFETLVQWEGHPVRSSRIRRALMAGDLEQANGCLGHPYRLTGIVAHGDQRGRQLGFPTANLRVNDDQLLPANGVYVGQAHVRDARFDAVVNVGVRPTFDQHTPVVEAHLLDFSGDIYGERLRLDFLHRLRDEVRFPSAEALIEQMHRDRANARVWRGVV
ncbi:MAG TPA: bifunctional riboflavin kinase/FAD synthetase [Anaerolineae bacterium]|nr:bifunctional riboflavin kinase/FAD synthetase [Anaerolineae bacterium]HQK15731.1 bifunctional riboflavin kinase/FAD synthetase [Anaerolineae bacterium]